MRHFDWSTFFYTKNLIACNVDYEPEVGRDTEIFTTAIRNVVGSVSASSYELQLTSIFGDSINEIAEMNCRAKTLIEIANKKPLNRTLLNHIYTFLLTTFYSKMQMISKITLNVLYNYELDNLLCDHSTHYETCYIPYDRFYVKHFNIGNTRKSLIKRTYDYIKTRYLMDRPDICPCIIIYLFFIKNHQNLFEHMLSGYNTNSITQKQPVYNNATTTENDDMSEFVNMLTNTYNYSKFNGYNFVYTLALMPTLENNLSAFHHRHILYHEICNEINQLEDTMYKIATTKNLKKKKKTNKYKKISSFVLFNNNGARPLCSGTQTIHKHIHEFDAILTYCQKCRHANVKILKVNKRADDEALCETIYCLDCKRIVR